ncbi:YdcF family protein [Kutzneria sp. CA-103260]|uniref:YdcF family protein n=1 Tax=Kutzneria sp. CA-103260 TaxID=2802641 RepID=UPI001BA8D222|nr:YdcF family protein [Kutzneria sp. CA-103260]QUQ62908.1 YdcF family protein [Kutzneria sp. CA-103260]
MNTLVWLAFGLFWTAVFVVSFLIDRRRLRNGVFLVMALFFLGFGALGAIGTQAPLAAAIPLILIVLAAPLAMVALTVFLFVNGFTMIRREGLKLSSVLTTLAGLVIVGFLALALLALGTKNRFLLSAMLSIGGILFYISFVFCCFLVYSVFYGRVRQRREVDFVVVLGAGLIDGKVTRLLGGRLDRGRQVWERLRGEAPMMITSGGQGADEPVSEARAMADYLIDAGVPAGAILLEDKSTTTLENLTFSRQIMLSRKPDYRCTVVTSNYHVLRAALFARRAKVNGQVLGAPTARYFWPNAFLREFVAILVEHRVKNIVLCLMFGAVGLLGLVA